MLVPICRKLKLGRTPAQALDYLRLVRAQGVRTRTLYYPDGKHPLGESISMEADVWVNMVMWALQRFDGVDFSLLPAA